MTKFNKNIDKWAILLLAVLLSFIQYFKTLSFGYVLDDKIVLSENNYVKKGWQGIYDIFTTESFVGYFGEQKDLIPGARYRPLSIVTFAIEYGIWKRYNPRFSHLINILLYALVGWLLYIWLKALVQPKQKCFFSIPFFTFLIWIAHPVHSEAVANIKGRDEILALLFSLLTMMWSNKLIGRDQNKKILPKILVPLFFLLGLLSKENTVTIMAIIPLSLFFFKKIDWKTSLQLTLLLVPTLVLYLIIRYSAVGYLLNNIEVDNIMNNPFLGMSIYERFASIFYVLIKYIELFLIPINLTHDYYPYQIPKVTWTNGIVILSIVLHFAMIAVIMWKWKAKNTISWALFFYIASLSIYSNIVINVGTTMNERFLFMPSIGMSVLVSVLLSKLKVTRIVPLLILGTVAGILLFLSHKRSLVWESAMTLNRAAIKVSVNSARANLFMGTALFEEVRAWPSGYERKAKLNEAYFYINRSVEIIPDYYDGNKMKAGVAAELQKEGGKMQDLLNVFFEVGSVRPEIAFIHQYIEYLKDRLDLEDDIAKMCYKIGQDLSKKGNHQWALYYYKYAIDIDQNNPFIVLSIAKSYEAVGNERQFSEFMNLYQRLVQRE